MIIWLLKWEVCDWCVVGNLHISIICLILFVFHICTFICMHVCMCLIILFDSVARASALFPHKTCTWNASSSFIHNFLNLEAVVMAFSGCSVAKSCLNLCDPMDCSIPGFPVLRCLPQFAQTQVHWVGDAIQPSYPLSPPSPLSFNLSQYQGPFQWICSLHQVAKVLELQLQHQSFQWIIRVGFVEDWLLWSPCSPRDSRLSSRTASVLWCSAFFMVELSCPYMTPGKTIALTRRTPSRQSDVSAF